MNTPQNNIEIARRWLACFDDQNVDRLISLYAPDARHTSPKIRTLHPETGGFLIGHGALKQWWQDAFHRLPQLRYIEKTLTADENRVFMEYLRVVPGEPETWVAEVLDIKDGKIVASRVYHG